MDAMEGCSSLVGKVKEVHADTRRTISELNGSDFSVQLFKVYQSNLPLGKHAHRARMETFTILCGEGFVLICTVDGQGNKLGIPERHELTAGSVIHIPPHVAHTFYLSPGTEMHCYSSAAFDPSDFIQAPFLVV